MIFNTFLNSFHFVVYKFTIYRTSVHIKKIRQWRIDYHHTSHHIGNTYSFYAPRSALKYTKPLTKVSTSQRALKRGQRKSWKSKLFESRLIYTVQSANSLSLFLSPSPAKIRSIIRGAYSGLSDCYLRGINCHHGGRNWFSRLVEFNALNVKRAGSSERGIFKVLVHASAKFPTGSAGVCSRHNTSPACYCQAKRSPWRLRLSTVNPPAFSTLCFSPVWNVTCIDDAFSLTKVTQRDVTVPRLTKRLILLFAVWTCFLFLFHTNRWND